MGGEDFLSGGDGDAVRKTPSVQAGEHHPSLGQEVDGMAGGDGGVGEGGGQRLKPALGFVSALRLRTI